MEVEYFFIGLLTIAVISFIWFCGVSFIYYLQDTYNTVKEKIWATLTIISSIIIALTGVYCTGKLLSYLTGL